jgi:hypothetical protein
MSKGAKTGSGGGAIFGLPELFQTELEALWREGVCGAGGRWRAGSSRRWMKRGVPRCGRVVEGVPGVNTGGVV